MDKTKIVCTIGPASESREILSQMIDAGMDVARLNFSHGTHEEHAAKIKLIRELAAEKGAAVAILQDLAGPKIRTGEFAAGSVVLASGDEFVLTARDVPGDEHEVGLTYRDLPRDVKPGDDILLADGALEMKIESVDGPDIHCRVITGGTLGSHKGINLPSGSIRAPILTQKDYADLAFGISQGVDYVALSFVRSAQDIAVARNYIRSFGVSIPLISKIEKHEALKDLPAIIAAVDGVMVARGDLGVDIPLEQVPTAQRRIIELAARAGKPVITATQMLKSMTDSPRPTRAEVTDVTNAILEGTDAVMLSEESAAGHYPVEAVRTLSRIAREAEKGFRRDDWQRTLFTTTTPDDVAESLMRSACALLEKTEAKALLVATHSGKSAFWAAKARPGKPIVASTPSEAVRRRLALVRGVIPVTGEESMDLMEVVRELQAKAKALGVVKKGDIVILTAGYPAGPDSDTNLVKVNRVS
jgi:pyruvate kinase